MAFAIATIRHLGRPTPVIEVDGCHWALEEVKPDLLGAPERGLMGLFDDWEQSARSLMELAMQLRGSNPGLRPIEPSPAPDAFLTPLQFPQKVVLMGANYYDHVHGDAGHKDFRKEDKVPTLFLKPPSTTLVGCGKTVRYPTQSAKFDWEIELAAIIGRTAKRVSVQEAMDHVAGYAVGLDLSARDRQYDPKLLFNVDLFGGKAFDDSCPLGPKIVPARFVNHQDLQLQLRVNGALKQNANTRDMIWSLPEQIAAISQHLTLLPGDIVMTGTPAGVGAKTGTFLKVGDRIDAEITGLGCLSVEIVPDSAHQPRAVA